MIRMPTLAELANQAQGGAPTCPGCGRQLFAYGTQSGRTRIIRYEECKTPGCERRFKTKQPHRVIIEELSNAGKPPLVLGGG